MAALRLRRALVALLIASVLWIGAFALSEGLVFAELRPGEAFEYRFTPNVSCDWSVSACAVDGDARIEAELYSGDTCLARGAGTGEPIAFPCEAEREYRVVFTGEGRICAEVSRRALSRCAGDPLILKEGEAREKLIARAGDAHWYGFEAEDDGTLLLSCTAKDTGLVPRALLFDGGFRLLGELEDVGGTAILRANTRRGDAYYLRVDAPDGGKGSYALGLFRDAGFSAPRFSEEELSLAAGARADLIELLGMKPLYFAVSDPSVCEVTQEGVVTALKEGTAVVTAGDAAADAHLTVRVTFVPMTALRAATDGIELSAGDSADIPLIIEPEDCSDVMLSFEAEDGSVAEVSPDGIVRGLKAGETVVRVTAPVSGLTATVRVNVRPAPRRYRALLIAGENYADEQGGPRSGAIRSLEAVAGMLRTARFGDAAYAIRSLSDPGRAEIIAALRDIAGEALPGDVTLLYLSCHGFYEGGMSFFALTDGDALTARDLERELRRVPGTVLLLLDCCGSGGAIGRASFAGAVNESFPVALRGSKYKLLLSSALDEDSLRVRFRNADGSTGMTTLFARVLCEGCGWDIDRNGRAAMGADADYDGVIRFYELAAYMQERMGQYLSEIARTGGGRYFQTIQSAPDADGFVFLQRAGE